MATPEQLKQALINADKAGDVDAARKLAFALKQTQTQSSPDGMDVVRKFFPSADERAAGRVDADQRMQADMYGKLEKLGRPTAFAAGMMNTSTLGQLDNINAVVDQGLNALVGGGDDGYFGGSFKDRKRANQAQRQDLRDDHPVSSTAGSISGFMAPGGLIAQGGRGMAKAVPQASGQGAAYMQRLFGFGALGASENAAYEATTGASNRGAEQGRDVGFSEAATMAKEGFQDPLAWAAVPAASALFRGGRRALTGNWTNQGQKEAASYLGNILEGTIEPGTITPDGVTGIVNLLRNAGISLDDDALAKVQVSIQNLGQSGGEAGALPTRLKDVLVNALEGPENNFGEQLNDILRGVSVRGGKPAGIVHKAVDQDIGASRDALRTQIESTLGSQRKLEAFDQIGERLAQISTEGYQPIMRAGPQSQEGLEALQSVLSTPGSSRVMRDLQDVADAQGVPLKQMMAERPLEAAHWMQSRARKLADTQDATAKLAFLGIRDRLLKAINKASPGYDAVRKQYGDEFGNEQALEFGNKFLTRATRDMDVDLMAREFAELTEAQKEAALLSVRDVLKSSIGRGQSGSAPRLTQAGSEQVKNALMQVFGDKGDAVVKSIEDVDGFVANRQDILSKRGPRSTPDKFLAQRATDTVMPSWRRRVGGMLQNIGTDIGISSATGNIAPFMLGRSLMRKTGDAISGNPDRKLLALVSALEAPVRSGARNTLADAPPVTSNPTAGGAVAGNTLSGVPNP
jgi:hypothetical protein